MVATVRAIGSAQVHQRNLTVRPTWKWLIEKAGICRSTVAQRIADLEAVGRIVRVHGGRLKKFAQQHTGQQDNDAAVYGLALPREHVPVDETWTPPPEGRDEYPPHAREEFSPADAAPPRRRNRAAAARRAVVAALTERKGPLWPAHATVGLGLGVGTRHAQRELERLAALELQFVIPALRRVSTAHVASRCRPFFRAGWSWSDVHHALDFAPNGQPYRHTDDPGNVGAWLRHRLSAWLADDGVPRKSRGQRERARRAQEAAQRQAERRREARRAPATPRPSWFQRVRARAAAVDWGNEAQVLGQAR